MVPAFLVGAMSGSIGTDLGFDAAVTGLIVTSCYLVAAIVALPMGRFAERVGAGVCLTLGVLLSVAGCLAAAILVAHWWHLLLLMAALGATLPMVDTGAARACTTVVPPRRRAIAFGVKEASVPLASLLAGLAVPVLAATVGWRVAFAGGVLIAPLTVFALSRTLPGTASDVVGSRTRSRRPRWSGWRDVRDLSRGPRVREIARGGGGEPLRWPVPEEQPWSPTSCRPRWARA